VASYFSATDVFGRIVHMSATRWNTYVLRKRSHFAGKERLVIDAIENPDVVYEGNTPEHKVFKGLKSSGPGFYFGNTSVVVVVWYPLGGTEGHVTTVYTAPDVLMRKVLWKHP
jgi:hypothetical protein